MKLQKLSWVMVPLLAMSLAACGGEYPEHESDELTEAGVSAEQMETQSPEAPAVSEAGEDELGQQSQELFARCGHGTYAFARCTFSGHVEYGCKARTTGRIVRYDRELCLGCYVDRGMYYACRVFGPFS